MIIIIGLFFDRINKNLINIMNTQIKFKKNQTSLILIIFKVPFLFASLNYIENSYLLKAK